MIKAILLNFGTQDQNWKKCFLRCFKGFKLTQDYHIWQTNEKQIDISLLFMDLKLDQEGSDVTFVQGFHLFKEKPK